VSVLWECLATEPSTADDLFQWLLVQTHNSREQHALGLASIRHLYTAKLPQLQPESMTMLGLNLLSQLGTLVRAADVGGGDPAAGMHQVWRIALQAANTDVSLKAIHILNAAYLGRGEEFLTTCMKHLQAGSLSLFSFRPLGGGSLGGLLFLFFTVPAMHD
jgi:ubiquitin carboxyl-terminal hydrolase 34